MGKNKKKRIDVVYSTNPDFSFDYESEDEIEPLPPEEQILHVMLDKKQRKGKVVTLVSNFVGTEADLKELAKSLKTKCGVGGSIKDGDILIQGEFRDKVMNVLTKEGYKVKRVGG